MELSVQRHGGDRKSSAQIDPLIPEKTADRLAAEQEKRRAEANRKRSAATITRPREPDGTLAPGPVSAQVVQILEVVKDPTPTRTAKALASKTNRGSL